MKKLVKSKSKRGKHSRKPSRKDKVSKLRKLKAYQKGQRIKKKNRSVVHRVHKFIKKFRK